MMETVRTHKKCSVCKEEKPVDSFSRAGNYLQGACRPCDYARSRRWKEDNPERSAVSMRRAHLVHRFGITTEQYEEMLSRQGGVCAICERKNRGGMNLAVDHDHATGQVRGLLCNSCNSAIGLLDDSPVLVERALAYFNAMT